MTLNPAFHRFTNPLYCTTFCLYICAAGSDRGIRICVHYCRGEQPGLAMCAPLRRVAGGMEDTLEAARKLAKRGQRHDAIAVYQRILADDPNSVDAPWAR